MDLVTLATVKTLYEKSGSEYDGSLGLLITMVSGWIERWCDRHIERKARTEDYDLVEEQTVVGLRGYGIGSTITSVKHDTDRVFGSDTIVDPTDYAFEPRTGLLTLELALTSGPQVLRVESTAGLAVNTAGVASDYPDLALACAHQVIHLHQSRGQLGLQSVSFDGGSVAGGDDPERWLKGVLDKLTHYRRRHYARA